MSYKNRFGDSDTFFPTQEGGTIGAAKHRTMLDSAGGPLGITKRFLLNADGTTTRLSTRDGMPEFITEGTKATVCWKTSVTLDSGFVDTTFNYNAIGDENDGALQHLLGYDGAVLPDESVHLRDSHAWKERFNLGSIASDNVLYWGMPSNFSGLMRRLMQVQHGLVEATGAEPYEIPPGTVCPMSPLIGEFSCRYVKTHGLFIGPSGRRWIIEISSEGVFRIPISFVREFTTDDVAGFEQTRLASLGNNEAFAAEMKDYWTITSFDHDDKVKIVDAPACYANTGVAPFYAWCGWAFDYKGRNATVCLIGEHPSESSWYMAYMYDLTIAPAGADDAPSYVTSALSASSTLATNINDYSDNENAFIQSASEYPGKLSTVSLFSPVSVASQTIHAPIFSFYTKDGTKRTYYFDLYPVTAKNETEYADDVVPLSLGRLGDWTTGYFHNGNTATVPDDDGTPISYVYNALSISNGIVSEVYSGTQGGWGGFSGSGFPSFPSDFSGTYSYTARRPGPGGWASPGGYGFVHVSRLTMTYDPPLDTFRDEAQLLPARDQYYSVWMPATTVVDYASDNHSLTRWHQSTVLLSGYDREGIAIAHTIGTTTGTHTITGGYPGVWGKCIFSGDCIGGRLGSPQDAWSAGSDDWGLYAPNDGGYGLTGISVSYITGWYDWSPFVGVVASAAERVYTAPVGGSILTVPGINETIPGAVTATRGLYVVLGDTVRTYPITHSDFHQTYLGSEFFRFWMGASAFGKAGGVTYFCSDDISKLPRVYNLGSCDRAGKSLFGFVGVI